MHLQTVLERLQASKATSIGAYNNESSSRRATLGVSYPALRRLSKEIAKSDAYAFLDSNDFSFYELEILQCFVIGLLKEQDRAFHYWYTFLPKAKEWSVVDSLCQSFVIAKKFPEEMLEILRALSLENDEFLQRIVSVMLLSHFIKSEYIDEAISLIDRLNHPGYYCKMGRAWALATMMIQHETKVIDYLKQHRLDKWTHNKAIQKMRESFRIRNSFKTYLIELKR